MSFSKTSKPPFIIPFFISHQGCPHVCVFCNQHSITGRMEQGACSVADIRKEIEECLSRPRRYPEREVQVAFYGGSFTALDIKRQHELLGAVRSFINMGKVDSIRVSTRPDYMGKEVAQFLLDHGVGTVELGIQSMDQAVLDASERGHSARHSEQAISCVQECGIKVGTQLMVGLPGETTAKLISGARRVAEYHPAFVRIYPALVIKGSKLEAMYRKKAYIPLSLNGAIARTARLKEIFDNYNIPVIRMGLQPSPSLEKDIVAGPYHPSFGELVMARMTFNKVRRRLSRTSPEKKRRLSVAAADQSIFRGPRNSSLKRLALLGLMDNVELEFRHDLPRHTMRLLSVSDSFRS